MANALTEPGFSSNPPVKLNVNARILGLVIAILAIIGAIFTLFVGGLLALISFGGGFAFIWLLGVLAGFVAEILAAIGGFQMYNLQRKGKDLVIYGLALAFAGAVVTAIGQIIAYSGYTIGYAAGGAIVGLIVDLIIYGILYYLVVISRFPGEAPLTAPGGGYGGYGGGSGYGGPPPAGGGYGGTTPPPAPPPGPSA